MLQKISISPYLAKSCLRDYKMCTKRIVLGLEGLIMQPCPRSSPDRVATSCLNDEDRSMKTDVSRQIFCKKKRGREYLCRLRLRIWFFYIKQVTRSYLISPYLAKSQFKDYEMCIKCFVLRVEGLTSLPEHAEDSFVNDENGRK